MLIFGVDLEANTMKIIEITVAHYDALNKFRTEDGKRYHPHFKEEMDLILKRGAGLNFVALEGNRVIGYVISDCSDKFPFLDNFGYTLLMDFWVENTHRRNAIASALLEHLASGMKARGFTKLNIISENQWSCKVRDLGSLAMFSHLTNLKIDYRNNDDLRSLADLPQLSELILDHCYVDDYSALAKLTQLNHFKINSSHRCKDFQFLANLTQLKQLNLYGISLVNKDIDLISNLSQLTYLSIGSCPDITDISPLTKLENLTELYFYYNENIQDFAPIGRMPNLRLLHFHSMKANFSDITFLRSLPHLTDLSIIDRNMVIDTPLCDFSVISDLTNLTRLDLSYNHIRDISFLSSLSNLTYLKLEGNRIKDLSPLDALQQQGLKELIVDRKKDSGFSYHGQEEV